MILQTALNLADDDLGGCSFVQVLGTVGWPIPETEIKVVDSQTGHTLPPGTKGSIKVRGPQVMKGYYKVRIRHASCWFITKSCITLGHYDMEQWNEAWEDLEICELKIWTQVCAPCTCYVAGEFWSGEWRLESIFMVFFILLDMGVSSSNVKFFRRFFFVFGFSLGMWVQ